MAGFFKRLVSKLTGKQPDLVEKIREHNDANQLLDPKADERKYKVGLDGASATLAQTINALAAKHRKVDGQLFADLERSLVSMDVGYAASKRIAQAVEDEVRLQGVDDPALIKEIVADKLFVSYINQTTVSTDLNFADGRTNVFILIGVNGAGKTTTIAKLAKLYKDRGKRVMIAAGDTFRAGAVAQLAVWAERVGVPIVKPDKDGQDPSSVIFDAVRKASEQKYDLVICDTAGRLQNKLNLMNELKKINGVISRFIPGAPHETLLVLDATTGQSGLQQAAGFKEVAQLTGIVLTKVDGSAKGGIILAIKDVFDLPVKLLGLGERLDDLRAFDLERYVDTVTAGLFEENGAAP